MSKKTWVKWGLLLAGSTVATLQFGGCITQYLFDWFILQAVN